VASLARTLASSAIASRAALLVGLGERHRDAAGLGAPEARSRRRGGEDGGGDDHHHEGGDHHFDDAEACVHAELLGH
jgi:hypothetical protein